MRYYDCGNYTNEENPPDTCKFCGWGQRDEPRKYETIVITCDGWF